MFATEALFRSKRPLVGVVHLPPLPGSPRCGGDIAAVERRALRDVRILEEEGFGGVILENFGDAPFLPGRVGPETVAAMTFLVGRAIAETRLPVGVNVLRNDARAALAVCIATGARFLRVNVHTGAAVTDQGMIEGRAWETLRERDRLGSDALIFADVLVKHASPLVPSDPARAARETVERGLADVLLVTGEATGAPVNEEVLFEVRAATTGTPVLVASGLDRRNARRLRPLADGAIVGTAVKRGGIPGGPVDRARARRLVQAWRAEGAA